MAHYFRMWLMVDTFRVQVVRGGATVYGGVVQLALVPVDIGALEELWHHRFFQVSA